MAQFMFLTTAFCMPFIGTVPSGAGPAGAAGGALLAAGAAAAAAAGAAAAAAGAGLELGGRPAAMRTSSLVMRP